MRKLLTFAPIIILAATIQCNAAQNPTTDSSVRLRVLQGRPVVEGVFLNGKGPFRFLLDTGAQTNQVEAAVARELNLTASFRVDMVTAAGTIQVAGGRVAEVSLGTAKAQDQEFLFTGLDGVHALSASIQGVLGQEFLAHFDYLLDLRGKRLTFDCAAPAGSRIPVVRVDGRMALRTSHGQMVLDSGTDVAILFRLTAEGKLAEINTNSGSAAAQRVSGLRMRIGDREYRAVEAAFVPQLNSSEDGLLPAIMFRSLFISNSEGYIVIEPEAGM